MANNDIYVRQWMAQCPYLQNSTVGANGKLEYGIYPGSANLSYRENVLGERILTEVQEMSFIFTSKRIYARSADYAFFTNIVKWIDAQNKFMNFPTINEGRVISVVPDLNQYVSEPNRNEERCQIQISITYKAYNS